MTKEEERYAVLHESALRVGEVWAEAWREELKREGRAVEGGWPGTMPEARARVAVHLGNELSRRSWKALTTDELGVASSTTYERARRAWLAMPRLDLLRQRRVSRGK